MDGHHPTSLPHRCGTRFKAVDMTRAMEASKANELQLKKSGSALA
jgi:hypothetical protein